MSNDRRFRAIAHIQRCQNGVYMQLDRGERDAKPFGDFLIGAAGGKMVQHFMLARRQARQCAGTGNARASCPPENINGPFGKNWLLSTIDAAHAPPHLT